MEDIIIGILSGDNAVASFLVQAFFVIGTLRAVLKPAQNAVTAIIAKTTTKKDDEFWNRLQANKIYAFVFKVIDYVSSIKLPAGK